MTADDEEDVVFIEVVDSAIVGHLLLLVDTTLVLIHNKHIVELRLAVVALEMVFDGLLGVEEACFAAGEGSAAGFLLPRHGGIVFLRQKGRTISGTTLTGMSATNSYVNFFSSNKANGNNRFFFN